MTFLLVFPFIQVIVTFFATVLVEALGVGVGVGVGVGTTTSGSWLNLIFTIGAE